MSQIFADAAINVGAIREFNRKELVDILDSVHGKKALVLDSALSGPLSLVAPLSLLKEHGVDRIYHLLPGELHTECRQILYLTRSSTTHMKSIADQVKQLKATNANAAKNLFDPPSSDIPNIPREFHLYFTPKRTAVCERVLEEEGVYGDLRIGEFHMDFVPLESDLLSLEMEDSFKSLYVDGDFSVVGTMCRALMKIQSIFGVVPKIYGKGHYSQMLINMLTQMRQDTSSDEALIVPEISAMVVIDRMVDPVTPLLTQLTYEGIIDEYFEIKNTFVELDPAVSGQKDRKKAALNNQDPLFSRLRDCNMAAVGPKLHKTSLEIGENYNERHNAITVSLLKEFVGKLGSLQQLHQALSLHTSIAAFITDTASDEKFGRIREAHQNILAGLEMQECADLIEELIGCQHNVLSVLRSLCLLCLMQNGMKPKQYDFFRHEILQTYGYHHLLTFDALFKCGLLYPTTSVTVTSGIAASLEPANVPVYGPAAPVSAPKLSFQSVKKQFNLIVDDVDVNTPKDMSYVYSGFAPLSCRIVQHVIANLFFEGEYGIFTNTSSDTGSYTGAGRWGGMIAAATGRTTTGAPSNPIMDLLNILPGPSVEELQRPPLNSSNTLSSGSRKRVVLVVFLGGCTAAEVSALRHLTEHTDATYIVSTTQMINGRKMISTLMDPSVFGN